MYHNLLRRLTRGPLARRSWPALALLLGLLALAIPAVARAQDVPRLQGQVTDLTRDQVLAGGRGRIDAALADLLQRENVQLFVLFIQSTGGRTVTQFADEVARVNSLGGNDALLVVGVQDRTDSIWRGSASLERLTERELEDVLSRRVEPLLARGDYAGAVVGAVEGIESAAGGGGGGGSSPSPSPWLLAIPAGAGGFVAWRWLSGRRRKRQEDEAQEQEAERRTNEANAALIAADEALRDAREEVGFAEAQFGEAEVAPYRAAVATASEELMAAFTLRQELDDGVPETPERRRTIVEEVIERAGRIQASLDEQEKRIAELRDLERTAPEVLAALPARIDALEGRNPAAERTLAGLGRYAERSWASVRGNIETTRELIARARAEVATGQQALGTEDRAAAGRSARTAQQAVTEATRLLDAIDALAASLRQAEESLDAQRVAAAADIRAARAALAGRGRADLDGRIVEAERALQEAERARAAERPDPLAAARLIAEADAVADAVLAEVQQDDERRERERRMLAAQIQAAETEYNRAEDFIAARRRAIGSEARTRLTEARRLLDRARAAADDDPATALAEARRAEDLAEDAYERAQDDVQRSQPYGGGWGGPMRGGVVLPMPMPFPIPTGGWGGGGRWGGGGGGGIRMGGGFGGGRSVGGRW